MQSQYNKIAKKIIRNNIYLTLSTAGKDGNPWAAPLFYCLDDKYNFYFISQLASLHVKHILESPKVAFSIFDSHQPEGSGNGIQGFGKAVELKDDEIDNALKWYRTSFIEYIPGYFKGDSYRIFKLVPKEVYILDPDAQIDQRVKVKLC